MIQIAFNIITTSEKTFIYNISLTFIKLAVKLLSPSTRHVCLLVELVFVLYVLLLVVVVVVADVVVVVTHLRLETSPRQNGKLCHLSFFGIVLTEVWRRSYKS